MLTVGPPLLLFHSMHECWKCKALQEVIALGSPAIVDEQFGEDEVAELVFLQGIVSMPSDVEAWIHDRFPRYERTYSKMAEETYFANVCECGANFGDHYLFSEPGGAFFPESEIDAAKIAYEVLPFVTPLEFDCGMNIGLGGFIMDNAKPTSRPS